MLVVPLGYLALLILGPLAIVAMVWVAERIAVPYPILLVALGALFYLVPWIGTPVVKPELVFYVFLPPLLYYAALFVAPDDLRANAWPIGLLALGVTVVTAAAVAGVLVGLEGVPLAVALVGGAVVGPTDTAAAISVFQRLHAPERLTTIVEGEGLTNDGAALVLYAGALDTAVNGAVRPGHLAVTLLAAPAGGTVLGLAIAWLLVQLRKRMDQPLLEITVSLATPYLTYAAADAVHLSGVLATVAAGVYTGPRLSTIYAAGTRLQAFAFVQVLVFLLNAILFTMLGSQLVRRVHWVPGRPTLHLVAVMLAVVAVAIAVRLIFMLFGPAIARLLGRAGGKEVWRGRVAVGWAGMRGGVSLAVALAIPLRLADGSKFPDREVLILVAAAVIVTSLLIQGTSLPWLLRRLGLRPEESRTEENHARLHGARAALAWLDDHAGANGTDEATESARAWYEAKVRRLQATHPSGQGPGDAEEQAEALDRFTALRLQLLKVERSEVLGLRYEGRINATMLRTIERELDLEEARLRDSGTSL